MGGMELSEGVIDEVRKNRPCVTPLYVLNETKIRLRVVLPGLAFPLQTGQAGAVELSGRQCIARCLLGRLYGVVRGNRLDGSIKI